MLNVTGAGRAGEPVHRRRPWAWRASAGEVQAFSLQQAAEARGSEEGLGRHASAGPSTVGAAWRGLPVDREGIAAGCEAWRAVLRRRPAPGRIAATICSPRRRERRSRGGAGAGGRGPPGAPPPAARAGARGAHAVVQAPAAGGRQAHQYHAGSVVMLGTTVAATNVWRRRRSPRRAALRAGA